MTTPIACTLTPGDYADRLGWIADLNRRSLSGYTRDGVTLVLTYAPEAAGRVRELAEQESRCCAFLELRVEESAEAVRLTVQAPESAADTADALLSPFLTGAGSSS